jgi:GxxExxY protein
MTENDLANKIIGLSIDIHKALGPGLLESAYKECLYYKIINSGYSCEKEKAMPLIYEEVKLECGYRIDLLVERKLIHLINFNVFLLKEGIKRVINGTL